MLKIVKNCQNLKPYYIRIKLFKFSKITFDFKLNKTQYNI